MSAVPSQPSAQPAGDPVAAPHVAPVEQPDPNELSARAEACSREVAEVLNKHRCRIGATLHTEPVGNTGGSALIRATVGVFAL